LLFRFCLYGFLKNQRYFESFWILAFLERGMTFALIGALIGFRELSIAALEIPTGAIADVVGRRWSMIWSHVAYIVAFILFGLTTSIPALFVAMFAFAVGEAFRTGTHKAIIFA
jgi:MFS family permease